MKKRSLFLILIVLFTVTVFPAFAQRTVTMVATEWAPYTEETHPSKGFHAELTVEAFKKVGYNVDIKFYP